jgi:hypothetical protein
VVKVAWRVKPKRFFSWGNSFLILSRYSWILATLSSKLARSRSL